MSLKSAFSKPIARLIRQRVMRDAAQGNKKQEKVFFQLVKKGAPTAFGKDHQFESIRSYEDFKRLVPVRDYEQIASYILRAKDGEKSVLWPGTPLYFCKTSGTTSGTKYIPLTRASLPNHIGSARNALMCYIAETGNADFVNGKMIFLQGSPKLDKLPSGIPFGRLSGIAANHVPAYLQKNRMPSYETNCIEDWETKVNAIAEETSRERMSLISGIPSWVQMYFEILLKKTGKTFIKDLFPDFSLFVYGGINFEPYRKNFMQLIGKEIPSIELYPASEGFIAYQDSQKQEGLLLNTNSGIFFEFIPADQFFNENPERISLKDVRLDTNYALVLSNNAGLWAYSIGDTIRFVSLKPHRIKVTGRIKHYTSAFGEHVISEEVDRAMSLACEALSISVAEFHVAPQVAPEEGLPYHEWFIESDDAMPKSAELQVMLEEEMQRQNVYYRDLIKGHVLKPAVLTFLNKGSFNAYMKSIGKLGGQNKVPRLANDRKIADELTKLKT